MSKNFVQGHFNGFPSGSIVDTCSSYKSILDLFLSYLGPDSVVPKARLTLCKACSVRFNY